MTNLHSKLRVKDWADEDRPREKLLHKGIHNLSNAELLAIIIGSGNRQETVVELAQRILSSVENNLNKLGKLTVSQLISEFNGIGTAKAVSIVAALELGKRRKAADNLPREQILCSEDIYRIFHPLLGDLHFEEFWLLLLNRSNKVVDKIRISQGGVSETTVDCRLILREAVLKLASGIVLCHNHPSGNTQPSRQDDVLTRKVLESARLMDIHLLDHVIISDENYFSYSDSGKM